MKTAVKLLLLISILYMAGCDGSSSDADMNEDYAGIWYSFLDPDTNRLALTDTTYVISRKAGGSGSYTFWEKGLVDKTAVDTVEIISTHEFDTLAGEWVAVDEPRREAGPYSVSSDGTVLTGFGDIWSSIEP